MAHSHCPFFHDHSHGYVLVQSPSYATPNSAKSRKGVLFSVSIYGLCQKVKARARRSRDRNKRRCCTVSGFHENMYSTAQFASTVLCLLFHAGREALYFKSSIFQLEIDSIRRREAEQERLWQIQKREKGRGMPIKFRTIFVHTQTVRLRNTQGQWSGGRHMI